MSQIEQNFIQFLSKNPEIGKCYKSGLINRRSLARYLIKCNIAKQNQLEAVIAMLRRFNFKNSLDDASGLFNNIRVNIKDKILILNFEKNKELLQKLQKLIAHTDYDQGDTLKIVVGTTSIKLFIDSEKENKLKDVFTNYKLKNKYDNLSEISLIFPENTTKSRGIISTITRELAVNNITISEILTASPELLIYIKEDDVLKAYEIIKRLQK